MTQDAQKEVDFSEKDKIHEIPLGRIEQDKKQPRKEFKEDELAESIKTNGQIQPILITKGNADKYKIVDGERRWRALNKLVEQVKDDAKLVKKFSSIRAIYVEEDNQLSGIVGNIARNSYNPMETADAFELLKILLGKDAKDDDVGKHVGKSRSLVAEYNSLLKLPKKIQEKARLDSCVPFRKLKVLAADKKMQESDKIVEYDKLHEEYTQKRGQDKQKKTDGKQPQTRETRSVVAVRKKLDEMKSALDGVRFGGKVDKGERDNLMKSLQAIIDTAEATIQRLSE